MDDESRRRHHATSVCAAAQLGCFTHAQAKACGFSRSAIARMIRLGVWMDVTSGVYMSAGSPVPWESRVMAAVLGTPGSTASHQTAARIRTLPVFGDPQIELAVQRHTNHEERLANIHELKDLVPSDVTLVGPIPVTTIPRTIVDLAAIHRKPRLERVLDDALVRRLTTTEEVSTVLERVARRGKPGVRLLRGLLAARAGGLILPSSELERIFYTLLENSALPRATRQWHPPWWDRPEGCVDAAWPELGVITEADGRRWHSRDQDNERDKFRDGVAAKHGYRVQRFTYEQITKNGRWVIDVLEGLLLSQLRRPA